MGKNRKSSSQKPVRQSASGPSKDDSRRTINSYEDVADSEDEFFINRDKILLDEGPVQKKRRKIEEEGMCPGNLRFYSLALFKVLTRCFAGALGFRSPR